jgi:tripartite-type tricarboxylate transporter receptor subunit TctC
VDDARWPDLTEVPTLREQGIADVEGASWVGFFVPAGTPQTITAAMGGTLAEVTADADVQSHFRTVGLAPLTLSRDAFQRMMAADKAWWKKVIEDNNIQMEP